MAFNRYHDHDGVGGNAKERMCGSCKNGSVEYCPADKCDYVEGVFNQSDALMAQIESELKNMDMSNFEVQKCNGCACCGKGLY